MQNCKRCCKDKILFTICLDCYGEVVANLESLQSENARLRKQKDGAYQERDKLVAAISKFFPSHLCRHPESDTTWENDWRWIVCVHAPTGQMTWHIHDSEQKLFDHLLGTTVENHWDGHSTEEKYKRLEALSPHEGKGGVMDKRIKALQNIIKIQCSNGNWNYDAYMHGMANGLLLAEHTVLSKSGSPKFLAAPRKWLKDRPKFKATVCDGSI